MKSEGRKHRIQSFKRTCSCSFSNHQRSRTSASTGGSTAACASLLAHSSMPTPYCTSYSQIKAKP
jgi:hypothetical protein